MRLRVAGAAAAVLLALAGCAAAETPGDAVDLCEEQLTSDVANAANASATDWEGGQVADRVFEYVATLSLDGVDVRVSCEVASTPEGFFLQDYDADPAAG